MPFCSEKELKEITSACADCAALKQLPKELLEFSTTPPSNIPGSAFACNVMCRARQKILVIKDTFSAFLCAKLIINEQKERFVEPFLNALRASNHLEVHE